MRPSPNPWKFPFSIILNVLIVVAIACVLGEMFFGAAFFNRKSKEAIAAMHETLQLKSSQEQASSIYEQFATDRTHLRKDLFEDTWRIEMPPEFGATDWMLYIQFDQDDRVSAIAMRSSDGLYRRPSASAADKGELREPIVSK